MVYALDGIQRDIIGVIEEIPIVRMLVEMSEEMSDGLIWERMLRILLRE